MIFDLAECEEIVGHSFRDKQILRTAFTHTSYANEHNTQSYERMEYLGDALLDFFVAEYLYRKYPGVGEGELTTRRAAMVAKTPLKKIAQEMNLGSFVLFGEGMKTVGEASDKILSSLIESAIAALYLDGGIDAARKFVEERVLKNSEAVLQTAEDSKSELQEFVQKYKLGTLYYEELKKSGPDHSPTFESRVMISGREIARGKGSKKQFSEQNAARVALVVLKEENASLNKEDPSRFSPNKGTKRKNKHPKEVRVLSLVADYKKGEKPIKETSKPIKKAEKKPSVPPQKAARGETVATEKEGRTNPAFPSRSHKKPNKQKPAKERNFTSVKTPSKNPSSQKEAKPPLLKGKRKTEGTSFSAPSHNREKPRRFIGKTLPTDGTPLV